MARVFLFLFVLCGTVFFPHFLWRGRVCLRVESGSWMLSLTPALHLFMEDNIYIGML